MFSLRTPLIGAGSAGGLFLGAVAWLTLGRGGPAAERLEDLQNRLEAIKAPAVVAAAVDPSNLSSSPVFAMTTGPGAVTEPTLALQGLSKTPSHSAALIAIDGKPADWLAEGASRDGVTVLEVRTRSVMVDTVTGSKEISLGQKSGPANGSAATATSAAPQPAGPPVGYRMPPPPADAPGGG